MSFLSTDELASIGLQAYGRNVLIDRSVQFFGADRISIGDNVRIDCFSLLSAGGEGIAIGSHIHISSGVYIYGSGARIVLSDFSGLSPGVKIFTASDDFSEGFLRGPQIPSKYRRLTCGAVVIRENTQIGAGAVILPNVELGRNASVGALSLISKSVGANQLVVGVPARVVSERDGELSDRLMNEFIAEWNNESRS